MVIGIGITLAIGLSYLSGIHENLELGHARAKALAMLTCYSASLVFMLSRFRTRSAIFISFTTVIASLVLIQTPMFSTRLHLSPLHVKDWAAVAGVMSMFIIVLKFSRFELRQK